MFNCLNCGGRPFYNVHGRPQVRDCSMIKLLNSTMSTPFKTTKSESRWARWILRPPSGAGEPNIIGAAADCTGIYGQQHPRRPRQQACNRKYGRQICSMHDAFCFKLIYKPPFRRWSWSHCKCVYCCRWCWCLSIWLDVTLSYVVGSTYTSLAWI